MMARRLKVEFQDRRGNRYTLTVEGRLSPEEMLRLVGSIIYNVGGPGGEPVLWGPEGQVPASMPPGPPPPTEMTLYERIQLVVDKYFPGTWFSSREVREAYEREFGEPVKTSTVSTYLARMAERGLLVRAGPVSNRRYRLVEEEPPGALARAY